MGKPAQLRRPHSERTLDVRPRVLLVICHVENSIRYCYLSVIMRNVKMSLLGNFGQFGRIVAGG